MIRALSPYYVTTPLVSPLTGLTCTDYTLFIKIWTGDKASPPAQPTYQITKDNNTASTGTDEISISRIVSDYIEFMPQSGTTTSIIDGVNQMWFEVYNKYHTGNITDEITAQNIITDIMSLGYSYGNEGRNNDIVTESTLIPIQEYKVYRNGIFIVPILLDESGVVSSNITIRSFPNSEINVNQNISGTQDSAELVKYIWVDLNNTSNDRYVEVTYKGETTYLYIEDECKYTPINVCFQNKDGALQNITFFKERIEKMTVTSSEFERSYLQPKEGFHQFVRYDVQGRTSLKANSGYVDETTNEVFRQMLLSEKLWIYEDSQFTPINIQSKNITYKTRKKERLINYELDFDYSYNQINNI